MSRQPVSAQTLHHVGFVVASIADAMPGFEKAIGQSWKGEIFHDPIQRVRVTFLGPEGAGQVELVEPEGPSSPVQTFLGRGGGLHHLCYEIDDIDARLKEFREAGGLVVRPPAPAVAFGGRRIAWAYTRERLLIEFLERDAK